MHNDEKVHCTEYREKNDFSTQNDDYFLFVYIYLFLIFFFKCCKDWYLCHIHTWLIRLYLRQQSVNVYCKSMWLKLWYNSGIILCLWLIVIKSCVNQYATHNQDWIFCLVVHTIMSILVINFVYKATQVYIYLVNVSCLTFYWAVISAWHHCIIYKFCIFYARAIQ